MMEKFDLIPREMLTKEEQALYDLFLATPSGEWRVTTYNGGMAFNGAPTIYSGTDPEYGEPRKIQMTAEVVRHIAAAHNATPSLLRTISDLRQALREILSEGGKVCADFEICQHVACQSSVAAWFIAENVLRSHAAETFQ